MPVMASGVESLRRQAYARHGAVECNALLDVEIEFFILGDVLDALRNLDRAVRQLAQRFREMQFAQDFPLQAIQFRADIFQRSTLRRRSLARASPVIQQRVLGPCWLRSGR